MELVQAFNAELSSLYEVKPPISKAKVSQITKVAIKGIKMYKHIVQSVERFIAKCRPEYKIPGLYVIDSIVRQSRHQFGADRDVFGPRFSRNYPQTFQSLFLTCPPDDKPKIVRVLNLWQRNNVFSSEIIQPLLDMANPKVNLSQIKYEDSPGAACVNESSMGASKPEEDNLVIHLQQLANSLGLSKNANNVGMSQSNMSNNETGEFEMNQHNTISFNKKLLDFDYGEDDEEEDKGNTPTEAELPEKVNAEDPNTNPLALSMAQNLLSNPELLQRLQQMQQSIQQQSSKANTDSFTNAASTFISSFQPVAGNDNNSDHSMNFRDNSLINSEVENHNFYDPSPLPGENFHNQDSTNMKNNNTTNESQAQFHTHIAHQYDYFDGGRGNSERRRSRSPTSPKRSRYNRSGYRDKDERMKRSRSRSPWRQGSERRSYRSRSKSPRARFDRSERSERRSLSTESKEREKERERRRRGFPLIKRNHLTICSTTLWLGHVPKLVSEADISDAFGEFGTINSIDLIPPRGCAYVCMNRRQDAFKALHQLKNLKLHGSTIKMAWAPGKGMKGKEYKDYWDVDLGASYIPWEKISENVDLELLEEGGCLDENTVPETLHALRELKAKEKEDKNIEATMLSVTGVPVQNMSSVTSNAPFGVATGLDPSLMSTATSTSIPHLGANNTLSSGMISNPSTGLSLPLGPHVTQFFPLSNTKSNMEISNSPIIEENQLLQESMTNSKINHLTGPPVMNNLTNVPSLSHTTQPLLPPPIFQPPPLNVPPPSLLTGQRPPPLPPWLVPPPILSGQNPQRLPHSFRPPPVSPRSVKNSAHLPKFDDRNQGNQAHNFGLGIHDGLPPRLHSERELNSVLNSARPHGQSMGVDRNRERFRDQNNTNEDPFAPSVYELKAMERNTGIRPLLSVRPPLIPRAFEEMPRERFPFERRFSRNQWRHPGPPPGPVLPFNDGRRNHHGEGMIAERDWTRTESWKDRNNRNDRNLRGSYSRGQERGGRSRWKRSPSRERAPIERSDSVKQENFKVESDDLNENLPEIKPVEDVEKQVEDIEQANETITENDSSELKQEVETT